MAFILDNSIAMRWLLESNKKIDQAYSEQVLQSMATNNALVPNLWHLEATNVLISAEKREEISATEIETFINQLESLPIKVDTLTFSKAFNRTLTLSKIHSLSSYDAAYLELAIREGVPLATLDKALIKAASQANVTLYLKEK